MKKLILLLLLVCLPANAVQLQTKQAKYGDQFALFNESQYNVTCYMRDNYNYFEFFLPAGNISRYYNLRGQFEWQCW